MTEKWGTPPVRLTRRGDRALALTVALLIVLAPGIAGALGAALTGVDDQGRPLHHSTSKETAR